MRKKNELTNILNQLVTNGLLTANGSISIIMTLEKLNKDVLADLLSAVKNKLEAIALLKTLSKYPNVVEAIKEGNQAYLQTEKDSKIFDTLNVLDEDILKVLVDYYTTVNKNVDVFDTSSRAESQLIDEDDATKLDDSVVSDSGINPPTDISKVESDIIDANELAAINKEAVKIYDRIENKNNSKNVIQILSGYYIIVYNDRHDNNKVLYM